MINRIQNKIAMSPSIKKKHLRTAAPVRIRNNFNKLVID